MTKKIHIHQQTGGDAVLLGIHDEQLAVPRCVSNAAFFNEFLAPALRCVGMGTDAFGVTSPELGDKEALDDLIGDEHGLTLLVLLLLLDGHAIMAFLYGHAVHARQLLDGFGKGGVGVFHHELDGVASFIAGTETVPGVAGLVHIEGRGTLIMEGAAALVVAALLLELRHIMAYDFDDIHPLQNALYGPFVNHRRLCHTLATPLYRQSICHRYAT